MNRRTRRFLDSVKEKVEAPPGPWVVRVLDDLWHVVRARLDSEVAVSFVVYGFHGRDGDTLYYERAGALSHPDPVECIDEAEWFIRGYVKWDGCSNLEFNQSPCVLHFCAKEEAERVGKLLGAVYDLAKELLPSADW